jgi:DNA polymerase III epsilon subunit-like protein
LVPLAHNWAFEAGFLKVMFGMDQFQKLFHSHARDAMLYALSLNDRSAFRGEAAPFNRVGLESLCKKFSVFNPNPHDALCDAVAEAEVYRSLLLMDLF